LDAKTIVGCVYGSTDADRDFPQLVDLVGRGVIDGEALVSQRIGLEDLQEAFVAMERGSVARSVIVFEQAAS
jgi:S-(hydroxymethyl)glutathione dehydrogenase/alcohol dehydrogenase